MSLTSVNFSFQSSAHNAILSRVHRRSRYVDPHHTQPFHLSDDINTRPAPVLNGAQPLTTEILKTLLSLEKSSSILPKFFDRANKKMASMYTSNTNEERADIKTNGDRISELQKTMTDRINDLRYNITELMSSQRQMQKTMTKALQISMGMLKDMVATVGNIERKTFPHIQEKPDSRSSRQDSRKVSSATSTARPERQYQDNHPEKPIIAERPTESEKQEFLSDPNYGSKLMKKSERQF